MAENGDDRSGGAWSRVPTWDGSPLTWRQFKREMTWWVGSLDLESTTKYNLAARWLLRQSGIVRQRGEEFDPAELQHRPRQTAVDPQTGETHEIAPVDYLHGLNKLLSALEGINGQSVLDKRGELRTHFYNHLQRKAGERMSEFATRFRTAVADLKAEGVTLPSSELGWFLKEKSGLDPLRKQLLETALQGQEEYEQIERESLRLFRDLHLSDPLFRRMGDRNDGNRPKLIIRRMFGQPSSAGSSSSASVSSFRTLSDASRRSGSSTPAKRVYLTEVPEDPVDEEAPEEEELVEDDEHMVLETAIQKEAQAFAAELEEAEQDGLDPSTIETLEANFESAAETLVTMREARNRLQEIRKDRGYKKPVDGAANVGQISKKNSKHPCFDCGLPGHWAGDKECQKPGQGLARKAGKVAAAPKQVRFAEVCQSDAIATDPIDTTSTVHEAAMVNVAVGLPLDQALNVNLYGTTHPVLVSDARDIAGDKMLVGALDSACNRTCSGPK